MKRLLTKNCLTPTGVNRGLRRVIAAMSLCMVCAAQAGTLGVFTSDAAGFDTHTFYYDDGREVTLIDTQFVPKLTAAMVAKVESETQSPITRVIVTHPNPDKFNGLAYLHGMGVRSISSHGVAQAMPTVHLYKKAFAPADYPAFENVQERFDRQRVVKLASGETLTLFALKHAGVSTQQVVVRIDATGDLIVGDLVHHRAHAWLEGGLVDGKPVPRIGEWIAALNELPALAAGFPAAKVYGGRGEFVSVTAAVDAQTSYLLKADDLVRGYVEGLGGRQAELWDHEATAKHSVELEQRFVAAFPEYRLPYMVRYSVYGLARADAKESKHLSQ
jgi:glyoxylase-like metal-dependent hydrolase (beta-lactamase superfamily II)